MLARRTGHPADSAFNVSLAKAYAKGEERMKARVWRHAYLGRYMGLSIAEIEAMPAAVVQSYVDAVSDIIRRENGTVMKAEG